jgi:hypothetical protein
MMEAGALDDGRLRWTGLGADSTDVTYNWSSFAALAADYWRYHHLTGRAKEEDDMAAWACVTDLMEDPSPRWADVLQALVDGAESDDDLGMIGAHAIEDLVRFNGHGDEVIAEIEVRARQDERFRIAVASIILGDDLSADLTDRLRKLGTR